MKAFLVTVFAFAGAAALAAQPTPDEMEKEARSLRVDNVAWRGIAWKSCLLEGLAEAKRTGKPAILWIFIDRPVNDERC